MMARPMETPAHIILFDGECPFCSRSVEFILSRDRRRFFSFASIQSEVGQRILQRLDSSLDQLDTIVLVEEDQCWTKSAAALRIVRQLSGFWPVVYVFFIVPRSLGDLCYDVIARNRYRWFGRHEKCFVPSPEQRDRFLA